MSCVSSIRAAARAIKLDEGVSSCAVRAASPKSAHAFRTSSACPPAPIGARSSRRGMRGRGRRSRLLTRLSGCARSHSADIAQRAGQPDAARFSAGALGNALSHRQALAASGGGVGADVHFEDDACLGRLRSANSGRAGANPGGLDLIVLGCNTNAIVAVQAVMVLKTLLHFDEA